MARKIRKKGAKAQKRRKTARAAKVRQVPRVKKTIKRPLGKPAKKAAKPRRVTSGAGLSAVKEALVRNLEELAVADMVKESADKSEDSIAVQDLVLSLTQATRKLGYNFGFSIGKEMHEYGGADIEVLFGALEKLGLGKVLYYPSPEHAIITSTKRKANKVTLGMGVHLIESGIIAGYLSGHIGMGVRVRETLCTYKDSDRCQFSAEPITESDYLAPLGNAQLDEVVSAIVERIDSSGARKSRKKENRYYLLLPSLPLMRGRLLGESSDVLYLAGGALAKIHDAHSYMEELSKIARYFDLDGVDGREAKGKRVIRLKYKQYNSIDGLVRLSSSMAIGFLRTLFEGEPRTRLGIGTNKSYFMEITI